MLWSVTLGLTGEGHEAELARLATSLRSARDIAEQVSLEIASDLPEYTVHDVRHLDALWDVAGQIVDPKSTPLNPAEAYVFGVAVLAHDLAMSAVAQGGVAAIESDPLWTAFVKQQLRAEGDSADITSDRASDDLRAEATKAVIRTRHADRARDLLVKPLPFPGCDMEYLISDSDLRATYGETIGLIAASHWWSVNELSEALPPSLNSMPGLPAKWTVDPVRVACLLRTSDAAHLSGDRAPAITRSMRNLPPLSALHWQFQTRMLTVRRDRDRLTFGSGSSFPESEAEAWWLCVDTLRAVDRELRQVDTLLADSSKDRFAARSVAYVHDIRQLAARIRVDGWIPVDASVQVGDVAAVVKSLGGQGLYGPKPEAAVRELVENGADALRARSAIDGHRGRVGVELGSDDLGKFVEVTDDGIGMRRSVLTGALLDFGGSYWHGTEALHEIVDVIRSDFRPVGKFGIGFFSVFMLGDHVRVTSRFLEDGSDQTHILEFHAGLKQRPILRCATSSERRITPGTAVRVYLTESLPSLVEDGYGRTVSLIAKLAGMFPTIDVSVGAVTEGEFAEAVAPNDWMTISEDELLARLGDPSWPLDADVETGFGKMDLLRDASGVPVARLRLDAATRGRSPSLITIGGARSESTLLHIAGVALGRTLSALREDADPYLPLESFATWARSRTDDLDLSALSDYSAYGLVSLLFAIGDDVESLPVAFSTEGRLDLAGVREWTSQREEFTLASTLFLQSSRPRPVKDGVLLLGHDQTSLVTRWAVTASSVRRKTLRALGEHVLATALSGWDMVFDPPIKVVPPLEDVERIDPFEPWGIPELDEVDRVIAIGRHYRRYDPSWIGPASEQAQADQAGD